MWNDWSDDTGAFPSLNKMEKRDIEGASGMQLARSLNVFSAWMLRKSKPVLDSKKVPFESISHVEDYWNDLCYLGKEIFFASCMILKYRKYETWPKD